MAFEWMKKIPTPLRVLKPFTRGRQSFKTGDSVNWKKQEYTARQVYELIHEGYLKDPFSGKGRTGKSNSKIS